MLCQIHNRLLLRFDLPYDHRDLRVHLQQIQMSNLNFISPIKAFLTAIRLLNTSQWTDLLFQRGLNLSLLSVFVLKLMLESPQEAPTAL